MKFYNPFKPHIIVNGLGDYMIRKLTIKGCFKGWRYLRYNMPFKSYYWVIRRNTATCSSSEAYTKQALEFFSELENTKKQLQKNKNKWRKV